VRKSIAEPLQTACRVASRQAFSPLQSRLQNELTHNHHSQSRLPIKGKFRHHFAASTGKGGDTMLWTLFVILLVLWLLGVVTSYTLGGFIHILLVLAVIALIFQLISGRRTVV
jgi:hypothetical protein